MEFTSIWKKENNSGNNLSKERTYLWKKISVKLSDMVKNNQEDISNIPFQKGETGIGESIEMTLFLKTRAFQKDVLKIQLNLLLKH